MESILYIKDPMILINGMDPYFKKNEPDCNLISQNNHNIPVHKEVLFQTKLLREMIRSVDINSKIEIICTSIDKEELEIIVKFLYCGEISCRNQNTENQVSRTLSELFGFPPIKHSSNLEEHFKQPYHSMLRLDATPHKRWLGFDFKFKKFSIKQAWHVKNSEIFACEQKNLFQDN